MDGFRRRLDIAEERAANLASKEGWNRSGHDTGIMYALERGLLTEGVQACGLLSQDLRNSAR